jgi:hypothetical protein
MLRSRGTDTRFDLSKKEATTDRKLSPRYELRGDRNKPSLWYGDQQLAEVVHFHNVGVSPDGRSVAWYTRSRAQDTSNLGNTSQYPTTLWFHSPETGTVKLAEGQFAWENYWDVFDNPILNPRFHWLSQTDFVAKPIVPATLLLQNPQPSAWPIALHRNSSLQHHWPSEKPSCPSATDFS